MKIEGKPIFVIGGADRVTHRLNEFGVMAIGTAQPAGLPPRSPRTLHLRAYACLRPIFAGLAVHGTVTV